MSEQQSKPQTVVEYGLQALGAPDLHPTLAVAVALGLTSLVASILQSIDAHFVMAAHHIPLAYVFAVLYLTAPLLVHPFEFGANASPNVGHHLQHAKETALCVFRGALYMLGLALSVSLGLFHTVDSGIVYIAALAPVGVVVGCALFLLPLSYVAAERAESREIDRLLAARDEATETIQPRLAVVHPDAELERLQRVYPDADLGRLRLLDPVYEGAADEFVAAFAEGPSLEVYPAPPVTSPLGDRNVS